jgi:peptide/nickel transport system permease protein
LLKKGRIFQFPRKLLKNRNFRFGSVFIFMFAFLMLFAPLLTPYSPIERNLKNSLLPPTLEHPLGCDFLGRDILSRILYGGWTSIYIVVTAISIGLLFSVPLGLISGYFGGSCDQIVMRFVDIMLAFPSLLLAIALMAVLGTGIENLVIAIGVFSVPVFTRLIRATTLSIREEDYVTAARTIGENDFNIILRYVLPNCLPVIVVQTTLQMGSMILMGAGLGFLGLGVKPPTPEWGMMISDARGFLRIAPHAAIFPGLAIFLLALSFNLMGDGLNDVLNPRLRK